MRLLTPIWTRCVWCVCGVRGHVDHCVSAHTWHCTVAIGDCVNATFEICIQWHLYVVSLNLERGQAHVYSILLTGLTKILFFPNKHWDKFDWYKLWRCCHALSVDGTDIPSTVSLSGETESTLCTDKYIALSFDSPHNLRHTQRTQSITMAYVAR